VRRARGNKESRGENEMGKEEAREKNGKREEGAVRRGSRAGRIRKEREGGRTIDEGKRLLYVIVHYVEEV
jgi:hypothetical protein